MLKRIKLSLVIVLLTGTVLAQPGDPGGNPSIPFTGVEYVLALGGLLGLRFIRKRAK
jgi:hypothetical protein